MHAVRPSPDGRAFSEHTWQRPEFIETPAMRYVHFLYSMRWFYDMVDADGRPTPDQNHVRATAFEHMVQQHSRASPTLLYPTSSPPQLPSRSRTSFRRSPSTEDTPMEPAEAPASSPLGARPTAADIPREQRTLRFDPDNRLVSYAPSDAPPRTDFTRKRRRKE